jgi:hypothetical protein
MVAHGCNSSYWRSRGRKIMSSTLAWGKVIETVTQKQNENKKTGGIAHQ